MPKTKVLSIRLSSETEHKLNWLLEDCNSGDHIYPTQSITDIIERCIHNEWVSINMANMAWLEEQENITVDPEYLSLVGKRVVKSN